MRRILLPGLLLVFATMAAATRHGSSSPNSADGRQPGRATAHGPSGETGRARVVRRDRFRLGPNTGICIETTMDAAVRPRIEASGEDVDLRGLTADPGGVVFERFRELGISVQIDNGRRPRLMSYIDIPGDASCLERPDTILIRQHVAAAGPEGYRVSIEASQGNRRYSASLTRSHTIVLPRGWRQGLALDAERVPGLTTPFWDVVRDLHRLSTPLINHLFAEPHREGQY